MQRPASAANLSATHFHNPSTNSRSVNQLLYVNVQQYGRVSRSANCSVEIGNNGSWKTRRGDHKRYDCFTIQKMNIVIGYGRTSLHYNEHKTTIDWAALNVPQNTFYVHKKYAVIVLLQCSDTGPPFPQIDIIGAMVIVWRVRGKIIRSVLCNIVCNDCAQCSARTWMDLTVLWIGFCLTGPISLCLDSFLYMYYCLHV